METRWTEEKISRFLRHADAAMLKALCDMLRPHEARLVMAEFLGERRARESAEMLAALGDNPAPKTPVPLKAKPVDRRQLAFSFPE